MATFNRKAARQRFIGGSGRRFPERPKRPRLAIHFSGKHVYAQVIDDDAGKTLAAASTAEKAVARQEQSRRPIAPAPKLSAKRSPSALLAKKIETRRLRSRRISISRQSESAGRRGARRRIKVLIHGTTKPRQTTRPQHRQNAGSEGRHDREGRVHQSLRQGRERRPSFQLSAR